MLLDRLMLCDSFIVLPSIEKTNISIVDNIPGQISFTWIHGTSNNHCSAIHYNILSSNCGTCPTTTDHTTVTCTDVPTDGRVCTFTLQAVFCGTVVGNWSESLNVITLKGTNIYLWLKVCSLI